MNEYDRRPEGYEADSGDLTSQPVPDPRPQTQPGPMPDAVVPTTVFCVQCGYNLTGVAIGSTCPECGRVVAPSFHSQMLPTSGKAIAALVLGICSILTCVMYGLPAIVCGILAMVFASKSRAQITAGEVAQSSRSMATAGLICGIIGLCLGIIYIGIIALVIVLSAQP